MASLFAFTAGGLVPFLTIILAPASIRIAATACAVLVALFAVGYISAHEEEGDANKPRAISRVVVGGLAAMAITYYVGVLFGTAVG